MWFCMTPSMRSETSGNYVTYVCCVCCSVTEQIFDKGRWYLQSLGLGLRGKICFCDYSLWLRTKIGIDGLCREKNLQSRQTAGRGVFVCVCSRFIWFTVFVIVCVCVCSQDGSDCAFTHCSSCVKCFRAALRVQQGALSPVSCPAPSTAPLISH